MREIAVAIYLFTFRLFFTFFKRFPLQQKTTFVASFGRNILYTMREVEKTTDHRIVILKVHPCNITFKKRPHRRIISFKIGNFLDWMESIYHLATSEKVIVDNYFGFLAVTDFKENVTCVQLWHAAGAIKQFGLRDLSIENRPPSAFRRFKAVYSRFDYVVIGSEKMATIFKEGFGIQEKQLLRTGIPRTDFFFDHENLEKAAQSLRRYFPIIDEKKVILYAPTYRDQELHVQELKMDIEKMYEHFHGDYVLFLSLHPAVKVDIENNHPDFAIDVTTYNINHLLVIADVLISDYSSIIFEYSLFNKPMVFFAYDIDEYAEERGFWEVYEELVPGPVVCNMDNLVEVIKNEAYDMSGVREFSEEWNRYSKGRSSEQLVRVVYGGDEPG
ncbi:CDP-glycerol glycerophosphotransferase family protein [Bacilli bacterium]|nr:CDP-glycerol glycerophosphotransferase family protein [Bacilli bacterium]PZD84483.1 CDP-glycerol glycerophosphotransferase family protein [Bacilli bacterium]PZD86754.1 CDP-glycerol glycerophosphotransferase family protein [Bacilli bacterium]RCO04370.1 CDP-glycerol glycerophosphotransferase family protein [Bacilli bacterium]RCO10399.1 CDP-glycerol glycerophosphotransferase family protein [Bacilli bacterium]